jgi:hypothetical protein
MRRPEYYDIQEPMDDNLVKRLKVAKMGRLRKKAAGKARES